MSIKPSRCRCAGTAIGIGIMGAGITVIGTTATGTTVIGIIATGTGIGGITTIGAGTIGTGTIGTIAAGEAIGSYRPAIFVCINHCAAPRRN